MNIELGVQYFIYAPNGSDYFSLNVPSEPNFIGYVNDITGLDSPGVRENAQVVVAGDGGYHGPFWKDRRPWTISGFIIPTFPVVARSAAQDRLEGIIGAATQADGSMLWTPSDGIQRYLPFRNQQPTRAPKGQSNVEKTFQLANVTADWRILSNAIQSVSATGAFSLTMPTATNIGTADASPKFVITGPAFSPITVVNITTGKVFRVNVNIAAATNLIIDLTGPYPVVTNNGVDVYGSVDPVNGPTDWSIAVAGKYTGGSGGNVFQVQCGGGSSGSSAMTVYWRHSWL